MGKEKEGGGKGEGRKERGGSERADPPSRIAKVQRWQP